MAADAASLRQAAKHVLSEIAKHANALAVGLQNAAPPDEQHPNNSILYLQDISHHLTAVSQEMDGSSDTEV